MTVSPAYHDAGVRRSDPAPAREEGQGADHHDDADQEHHEKAAYGSAKFRTRREPASSLPATRRALASEWRARTGNQHREATGQVIKRRIDVQSGKGAAVVVPLRRIGIEHFAEAVGTGIQDGGSCPYRG